jgi:hypothetical protein
LRIVSLQTLEDQTCGFSSDFDRRAAGFSPDRVDASVFAIAESIGGANFTGWLDYYREQAEAAKASLGQGQPHAQSVEINAVDMKQATTMSAPNPHACFYVSAPDGKSRRYEADRLGLIRDVAKIHIAGLRQSGCHEFPRSRGQGA